MIKNSLLLAGLLLTAKGNKMLLGKTADKKASFYDNFFSKITTITVISVNICDHISLNLTQRKHSNINIFFTQYVWNFSTQFVA
jgi:hypothetical protein